MSAFRMVDISARMAQGANVCAEELIRMGLQFGVEMDVVLVYRPRSAQDKQPSMVAHVAEKAAIGKLLEGAFEMYLGGDATSVDSYAIGADD